MSLPRCFRASLAEEVIATLKALPGCRDLDVANLQSPPVCQEWSTQAASVACPPECGEFFEKVGAECLVNMGLFINELMGVTIPAEEYTQTVMDQYDSCLAGELINSTSPEMLQARPAPAPGSLLLFPELPAWPRRLFDLC